MADFLARTDEHRLLHETAVRVFADTAQLGGNLVDTGLLAVPFAQGDGGLRPDDSSDRTDLAIAFAAKGQSYAVDDLLIRAVLGGGIIAAASTDEKHDIVAGVIEGRERIAVALHEPLAQTDLYHCTTQARRTTHGWTLDGTKTLVLGAADASRMIVLARIGERTEDPRAGLALFLLDPATSGIASCHYQLRDGSFASDILLTGVGLGEAALIVAPENAADLLDRVVGICRLCLAAEASGLMQVVLAGTANYVSERKQFGQAIGSFPVIQHRLADMATLTDQAGALVAEVASKSDNSSAMIRAHRAVAEMGMTATKSAIQLHGGYGMTEDLPYGQALRRMMTVALLF